MEQSLMGKAMAKPYQPSLLRLLHGATGLLVGAAWLSGLVLLLTLDRRWGALPFALPGEWVDIHGMIGVALLPIGAIFGAYAITIGRHRLGKATNLVPLLARLLALISGKLMQEDWLRDGQLHKTIYSLHLSAWLLMAIAVILHLIGVLRRGHWPLVQSMLHLGWRPNDSPTHWWGQLQRTIGRR
jgi:hypothetical protein